MSPCLRMVPFWGHFIIETYRISICQVISNFANWVVIISFSVGTAGIILQAPTLYDTRPAIDEQYSEIETPWRRQKYEWKKGMWKNKKEIKLVKTKIQNNQELFYLWMYKQSDYILFIIKDLTLMLLRKHWTYIFNPKIGVILHAVWMVG